MSREGSFKNNIIYVLLYYDSSVSEVVVISIAELLNSKDVFCGFLPMLVGVECLF